MPEIVFLGTGTSNGIPVVGCDCAVCRSRDARDRRTRSSVVVRYQGQQFLIDTATELRLQAVATGLDHIDAVLMTHAHADHTGGFDDLRRFNELQQEHLPVYADPVTAGMLRDRYAYTFVAQYPFYGGKPDLNLYEVDGPFTVHDVTVIPIPVHHGRLPILGYRFGDLAYITDAKVIPPESMELLRDLDLLVLNALRERPHPTHLSLGEAIEIIEELQPRRAFLTHLSHELGHAVVDARLPASIQVAYDGMKVQTMDEAQAAANCGPARENARAAAN